MSCAKFCERQSESGKGVWKTRRGGTYRKTLPRNVFGPPPTYDMSSLHFFWRLSVISLQGKRHQSQCLRHPKVVLQSTLYSTFPPFPPPKSRDTFCPPSAAAQNTLQAPLRAKLPARDSSRFCLLEKFHRETSERSCEMPFSLTGSGLVLFLSRCASMSLKFLRLALNSSVKFSGPVFVWQRLMGETKWEKGRNFFLRFPAVFCGSNHLPCRSRTKSAKICENLRQAAVSPFQSLPFSTAQFWQNGIIFCVYVTFDYLLIVCGVTWLFLQAALPLSSIGLLREKLALRKGAICLLKVPFPNPLSNWTGSVFPILRRSAQRNPPLPSVPKLLHYSTLVFGQLISGAVT